MADAVIAHLWEESLTIRVSDQVSGSECRGIEKNKKEEMVEILFFRGRFIILNFETEM